MESFDKAHSGRCPGCGMMDLKKTHWTHRYSGSFYGSFKKSFLPALAHDLGVQYLPGIVVLEEVA